MADHNSQFYSLDERAQFLEAHRPLWEERPFVGVPVSWESRWPELSRGLRALPESEISVTEGDPLAFLASQKGCAQLYQQLVAHSSWPSIDSQSASVLKSGQSTDSFENNEPLRPPRIEKRKWSQIVQFVACISAQAPTGVNHGGAITVAPHFAAWAEFGLTMGDFYEVSLVVEGYQSAGWADVNVSFE